MAKSNNPFRTNFSKNEKSGPKKNPFAIESGEEFHSRVDYNEPLVSRLPVSQRSQVRSQLHVNMPSNNKNLRKSIGYLGLLTVFLAGAWLYLSWEDKAKVSDLLTAEETGQPLDEVEADIPQRKASKNPAKKKVAPKLTQVAKPAEPALETKPEPQPLEKTVTTVKEASKTKSNAAPTSPMWVTSAQLRVRTQPNLSGDVVRTLSKGDKVFVIKMVGKWAQIGESEYVGARHLSKTENKQKATSSKGWSSAKKAPKASKRVKASIVSKPAASINGRHKVKAHIKVRSGAGPRQKVVGYVRKGTVVKVEEQRGVWGKIGKGRYVHMGNLERITDNATAVAH